MDCSRQTLMPWNPHLNTPSASGHRLSVESLDDHGHALAAADAHGFQADGLVPGDQAVEEGGGDPGAGHAERVAQRDGAAVHVEPVDVDAELAVGGNHR